MAGRSLTDAEIAANYNIQIWRALKCAGGFSRVAHRCEVSESTPRSWARKPGHVPEKYRQIISEMTGGVFTPDQLTTRQESDA